MADLIRILILNKILSTSLAVVVTTTTECPLPPCQNPCAPYESGAFHCEEGDVICQGYADCSGCYAKYFLNGVETTCTETYIDPKVSTTVAATTPCFLPPCVNPCGAFENMMDIDGNKPYCKQYPNTQCQGYADCSGCYAKYFDGESGEEIIHCELVYGAPSTTAPIMTTEETDAKTTDCLIDCADPCAMSECALYPDAHCDFYTDCDEGCVAFYTDDGGNIVDCEQTIEISTSSTAATTYSTENAESNTISTTERNNFNTHNSANYCNFMSFFIWIPFFLSCF